VAGTDGTVYANGEAKHEIVRVDTATNKATAHWPMPGCDSPHGLAIDTAGKRLFASCANRVMVVMDATDGQVLASLPIGPGTDAAAFDPKRKLAFSSNGGDGTITIIGQTGPRAYAVVGTIKTAVTGRTMAVDPATGRLFVAAADADPASPPGGRPRPVP